MASQSTADPLPLHFSPSRTAARGNLEPARLGGRRETVVRHAPLLALGVSEELGAGHEEDAPASQPARGIPIAIRRGEHLQRRVTVGVQVGEPGVGGPLIMPAVPEPLPLERERRRDRGQQVRARHQAA